MPATSDQYSSQTSKRATVTRCTFACLALLACLPGCVNFDVGKSFSMFDSEPEPGNPTRLTAIWTETILHQTNQRGVRGFGGRVTFFDSTSEDSIKVDGTVVVYAFDDTAGEASHNVPDRKYVFTPDQLSQHYGESTIGHSYSLWIPWDDAGGEQKQISLIVRFIGKSGGVLMSKSSRLILPGTAPELADDPVSTRTTAHDEPPAMLQSQTASEQVGYEDSDSNETNSGTEQKQTATENRSTVTIDVSPSFARRNLAASNFVDVRNSGEVPATNVEAGTSSRVSPTTLPEDSADGTQPRRLKDVSSAVPIPEAAEAGQRALQPTRYSRSRYRVQRAPRVLPGTSPVRRQPRPASWLSGLPPTPRSTPTAATRLTSPDGLSESN